MTTIYIVKCYSCIKIEFFSFKILCGMCYLCFPNWLQIIEYICFTCAVKHKLTQDFREYRRSHFTIIIVQERLSACYQKLVIGKLVKKSIPKGVLLMYFSFFFPNVSVAWNYLPLSNTSSPLPLPSLRAKPWAALVGIMHFPSCWCWHDKNHCQQLSKT